MALFHLGVPESHASKWACGTVINIINAIIATPVLSSKNGPAGEFNSEKTTERPCKVALHIQRLQPIPKCPSDCIIDIY